jgi:uncharacterized protein
MRFILLLSVLFSASISYAGGSICARGYCLDDDGNGCHPCFFQVSAEVRATPTGIPLDAEWKKQIYAFAQKNVVHPAWGLAHSERDYQVTKMISQKEGFPVDGDVLFAVSFLHDLGGIGTFAKKGVDHAERSVEIIEPLLADWGFPMQKWPQVKEMILGHTYYGPKPTSRSALAFRDADILDFMGSIGVARILAVTEESDFSDGTLKPTVDILKSFANSLETLCDSAACRELARPRKKEMQSFLQNLKGESFQGKAL